MQLALTLVTCPSSHPSQMSKIQKYSTAHCRVIESKAFVQAGSMSNLMPL
jgi:hypothetical protein